MARLNSPPEKYGTFDNICVYPMYGKAYMRTASSLTGERVKEDPAFKNTMASAERLAAASRLAAAVYAMLSPSRQKIRLYRKLTGKAIKLLKEGNTEGGVVVELMLTIRLPKRKPRKKPVKCITQQLIAHKNEKDTTVEPQPAARRKVPMLILPFTPAQKTTTPGQRLASRRGRYAGSEAEVHRYYG